MLRFGTHQVSIEFAHAGLSETEPAPADSSQLDYQTLRGAHAGTLAWCDYVTHYSKLELSHPDEDKLMALASIARVLLTGCLRLNGQYVA